MYIATLNMTDSLYYEINTYGNTNSVNRVYDFSAK